MKTEKNWASCQIIPAHLSGAWEAFLNKTGTRYKGFIHWCFYHLRSISKLGCFVSWWPGSSYSCFYFIPSQTQQHNILHSVNATKEVNTLLQFRHPLNGYLLTGLYHVISPWKYHIVLIIEFYFLLYNRAALRSFFKALYSNYNKSAQQITLLWLYY